jgi:hypothetical protein
MYWSSALARVTLSTMKRILNCHVKSWVVEVKIACLGQSQSCQVVACCMLHACLVACCMHAWHVHAKLVSMHAKSRASCNWSLKSSSIFELKCEAELCQACFHTSNSSPLLFSFSLLYKKRLTPLFSTVMQCKDEAIEAAISVLYRGTYQHIKGNNIRAIQRHVSTH